MELWRRQLSNGELLFVEVVATAPTGFAGDDDTTWVMSAELRFRPHTPDGPVAGTQRYTTVEKARRILAQRGYVRVPVLMAVGPAEA